MTATGTISTTRPRCSRSSRCRRPSSSSRQWMGTDVVPWWDSQQGVRHPWMTGTRCGRSIGEASTSALTREPTSISARSRDPRRARRDSRRPARARAAARRAGRARLLTPMADRNNLTDANRELVKAAGFRCCCSAAGGINCHRNRSVSTASSPDFALVRDPASVWLRGRAQENRFVLVTVSRRSADRPIGAEHCCATLEATGC